MKTSTQFRKKLILSTSLLLVFVGLFANSPYTIKQTLQWSEGLLVDNPEAPNPYRYYHFAGAVYQVEHLSLPYFTTQFEVPGRGSLGYEIVRANYEPFDKVASPDDAVIGEALEVSTRVEKSRQQYLGTLTFLPIRRRGKRFERLVSFELKVVFRPAEPRGGSRNDFTFTSELSEGDIYKMAVNRSGLHRIDYTFLKDELNIDIDNVDPRTLKILGNSGGPLPLANAVARHDDLEENAILVVGENDGRFNEGDYILFYAQGPHRWDYNSSKARFDRETNVFDDKKYYFLKISAGNGKRVGTQASLPNTEYTTTSFNDYRRLEDEFINLLFEMSGAQGSGRSWYGDLFSQERQRSYDFNFPFLDTNSPVNVTTVLIGRHNLQTRFTVTANSNQTFESNSIRQSPLDKVDSDFANSGSIDGNFTSNGDGINILVNYPAVGDGTNRGWLDYIQLNARRKLNMVSEPLAFRDAQTLDYASSTFELSNVDAEVEIWDITNGQNPLVQSFDRTNDLLRFGVTTNEVIREFVAFRRSNSFPSPERVGKIANQNIHSIDNVDMVIIYHPNFASQAEQLAQHRRTHSNLDIATVAIGDIYNEFSSGGIDPTAIRDFARMLYLRNSDFHYMLLFGDASFDYKNKYGAGGNFVPTFETLYSLNALSAYPTDDYYSYLDEDEGDPLGRGRDIAVGRLPARSATEAQGLVNKIIHYDTNSDCLGDWRNRLIFVADDEDNNIHLRDTDSTAEVLDDEEPDFNQSKIYLDAFFQESTPGGARIPQAQESLNRDMFRGTLAINYLGHGGSSGWAQERVLRQSDISSWENYDRLPLFITATCSFAGFDEPDLNTAGELAITRPDGGAIALFTTVRAVFAQQNKRLTDSVFDFLLKGGALDSPSRTIGEILRIAKDNAQASADNTLKFTLLGDPSMKLALPRYRVATTHINGVAVEGNPQDTIGALEKVTVRGLVTDDNGNVLEQFNGRIFPTVYDKETVVSTLGQDESSSPVEFRVQKSIIFKGAATVRNGAFEFTFVVPQDIDYDFGQGRISYYAEDGQETDARGYFEDLIVGGSAENPVSDGAGPLVEVFINDENFVSGGLTNANPALFVRLSDDNGINVAGTSVGHDLTAILDGNTQAPYILNDFYEAEQDDFTKGRVRFPIFDLAEGRHQVEVTAWDVANNFSTGSTEFVVANTEDVALDHVLNYPNPFTTSTNFQFEHNLSGLDLEVQVQIFTVSGRLVKTIVQRSFAQGNRVTDVHWDGTDDFGDQLAKGVYVYRVKLRAPELLDSDLKAESDFERLVILR